MGSKKSLYYSISLFLISIALLISASLGWFVSIIYNTVGDIALETGGSSLFLYESVDLDQNGVADVDGSNNTVFQLIGLNDITIKNCFPMYTVKYKALISVSSPGAVISLVLKGISTPSTETPTVDVAKAFSIRYIDPQSEPELEVDKTLDLLMDENRDAIIINNLPIAENEEIEFDFEIYMMEDAGNEYKNQVLGIDRIVLSIAYE